MSTTNNPLDVDGDTHPSIGETSTTERHAVLDGALVQLLELLNTNTSPVRPLTCVQPAISFLESLPVIGRDHLRAAIIREPMAIALLLRRANTRYGDPISSGLTDIDQAIDLVGEKGVLDLLGQLASVEQQQWRWDRAPQHLRKLWTNTVFTALAAKSLAKRRGDIDPSLAFSAAALHNIGEPLIIQHLSAHIAKVKQLTNGLSAVGHAMAASHQTIGAAALRAWNIPDRLVQVARLHHGHSPDPLSSLVLVAWQAALHYGYVYLGAHPDPAALERGLKRLQLSTTCLNNVTREILGDLNSIMTRGN